MPPPYVIRWTDEGKPNQRWLVVPAAEDRCYLVNCANREHMGISSEDGYLVRWSKVADTKDRGQEFSVVPDGDGWNILASNDRL